MSNANSSLTIRVQTAGVPQVVASIESISKTIKNFGANVVGAFGLGFGINEIVQLAKNAVNAAESLGRLSQECAANYGISESMAAGLVLYRATRWLHRPSYLALGKSFKKDLPKNLYRRTCKVAKREGVSVGELGAHAIGRFVFAN
jgi:hypothetical protein